MKSIYSLIVFIILSLFILSIVWKNTDTFGRFDRTVSTATEREHGTTGEFWDHYYRAADARIAGEYDRSAEAYQEALTMKPNHESALYYLGHVRLILRDFDGAHESWLKLLEINPESQRVYMQLGSLYFCRNERNNLYDPKIAKKYFHQAWNLNREDTGPPLNLAKIAVFEGDIGSAGTYLDTVVNTNPKSYQSQFLLGYIIWKETRNRDERNYLLKSAELYQNIPAAETPGEGNTTSGSLPILSVDMYCDFFKDKIIEKLEQFNDRKTAGTDSIYGEFDNSLEGWRRAGYNGAGLKR